MGATTMDLDAFIDANERAVFRFCLQLCGRRELAEELTQECFLRVLGNHGLLAVLSDGQRIAWLFTTARHLALDGLRAARRDAELTEMDERGEEGAAHDLERSQLFEGLGPKLGEALRLKIELGLNSREISERLGVPEGTVRRRLQLGLQSIRSQFFTRETKP